MDQKSINFEKKTKKKRKKGEIVEPVSDTSLGKNTADIDKYIHICFSFFM